MLSKIIIVGVGLFIGYSFGAMNSTTKDSSQVNAINQVVQKLEDIKTKVDLTSPTGVNPDKQLLSLMNAQTKSQQLAVEYGNLCKINPTYCASRDQLLANVKTLSADVVAFQKSMSHPSAPAR